MASNSTLELFSVSSQAMARLILTAAAGALMAKLRLLNGDFRTQLSRMVMSALIPALLWDKIASSVDAGELSKLFVLPLFSIIHVLLGLALGYGLSRWVLGDCSDFSRLHVANSVAWANTGGLPLIVVPAVVQLKPWRRLDPSYTSDAVEEDISRGIAYISVYLVVWTIALWLIGFNLVKRHSEKNAPLHVVELGSATSSSLAKATDGPVEQLSENGQRPSEGDVPVAAAGAVAEANDETDPVVAVLDAVVTGSDGKASNEHCVVDLQTTRLPPTKHVNGIGSSSANEGSRTPEALKTVDIAAQLANGLPNGRPSEPIKPEVEQLHSTPRRDKRAHSRWQGAVEAVRRRSEVAAVLMERLAMFMGDLRQLINAPTAACCAALFVGLIPPLKGLFFGEDAPLGPTVTAAASALGSASVPLIVMILGANMFEAYELRTKLPARLVMGIAVTKLVVVPALGTVLVVLSVWAGIIVQDELLIFVVLLEAAPPTAMSIILFCQVLQSAERPTGSLLLFEYVASIFTLTAWIMFFIWLAGRLV